VVLVGYLYLTGFHGSESHDKEGSLHFSFHFEFCYLLLLLQIGKPLLEVCNYFIKTFQLPGIQIAMNDK
jgi:hypothetical protein